MNSARPASPRFFALLLVVLISGCDGAQKPQPPAQSTPPATVAPAVGDLPRTAGSFSTAKKWLYDKIYYDHRVTFYCGCRYDIDRQVDLTSCGVVPRKNADRAKRVEAEHVFPAHQFGNFRECWRAPEKVCGEKMPGRKCCEKSDPVFVAAHNDLHNLYPAVGEINGDRSNYNWGMIAGERRNYGQCNIEVDPSIRRAEPPEGVMGDIARTMFYMSDTYRFNLSRQDEQLYTAWSRMDPPDVWEIERNRRIKAIQGRGNRFVEDYAAIFGKTAAASAKPPVAPVSNAPAAPAADGFSCGGKRYCREMASCEEAKFYLTQCGVGSLDRDKDGVPCESLCR